MDAESSVPDVQQLTKLAAMADQFSINNKDYIKMLGPVEQSCLWKTTILKGTPYNKFLSPPVDQCLSYGMPLQAHHPPTAVVCYTWDGPIPASKLTLRCDECSINYRYEQYGDSKNGYRYYPTPRPLTHSSQASYIDKTFCTHMGAAA